MNEMLRSLGIADCDIDVAADDPQLINPTVALLDDPRILNRVRNHFFPGWAAKGDLTGVHYEERPLYIIEYGTRDEADMAWYAKPPGIRVQIIPAWKEAEGWWAIPQLDAVALDRGLTEASRRLALAGALMDEDWAGLRSLAVLRSHPRTTIQSLDAAAVSRLVETGLAKMRADQLSCTKKGLRILKTIELTTGVNLTDPQIAD